MVIMMNLVTVVNGTADVNAMIEWPKLPKHFAFAKQDFSKTRWNCLW